MLTYEVVKAMFDYVDGKLIYKHCPKKLSNIGKEAGFTRPDGYCKVSIGGKQYYQHRVIFLWHKGFLPKLIDHADGDVSNNRIGNLREATSSQNNANRIPRKNKHGVMGVTKHKPTGLFHAKIRHELTEISLGYYKTPQEAGKAYAEAANQYHGKFFLNNRTT